MVKIQLSDIDLIFEIMGNDKAEMVEIRKGLYRDKYFTEAVFVDHSVILEGEEKVFLTHLRQFEKMNSTKSKG